MQKELAKAEDVGLSTPMNPTIAKDLATAAKRAENLKKRYPGSVILTKNRPQGDVLFGVDNTFLSKALNAGIFEPYTSPAPMLLPSRRMTCSFVM